MKIKLTPLEYLAYIIIDQGVDINIRKCKSNLTFVKCFK